jgi:hypothetical protein
MRSANEREVPADETCGEMVFNDGDKKNKKRAWALMGMMSLRKRSNSLIVPTISSRWYSRPFSLQALDGREFLAG